MTKSGLVWIEPSKTTVEGLNTLLEALTQRVDTLENTVGNIKFTGVAADDKVLSITDKLISSTISSIFPPMSRTMLPYPVGLL